MLVVRIILFALTPAVFGQRETNGKLSTALITRKRDTEFDLVERIHECESVLLKRPPEPAHTLTVTLEPDDFTEEKFRVYENYQQIVHQESPSSISRDGFKTFLCSSPLRRGKYIAPDGRERQVGSFHQCYRLDEDGYRYKIDFSPQQILNPNTLEWVDLEQSVLEKFDSHGYLDFESTEKDEKITQAKEVVVPTEVEDESQAMNEDDKEDDDEDKPLFSSNMPGIPSIDEMGSLDLDHIAVRLSRGYCYAGDLFEWHNESIDKPESAKAMVAELVAAVGPENIHDICLDFRR
ncbi:hypothetical protein Daesc_003583 [Daldinia eschscholtzii]|uniref:N-end rule aminoacyl transferase C-terminal domain-containing protein n=1 Tax=Daldinia eschscholtzii TaxID=292717 RepID=A0AAX6MTU1_9PEZI